MKSTSPTQKFILLFVTMLFQSMCIANFQLNNQDEKTSNNLKPILILLIIYDVSPNLDLAELTTNVLEVNISFPHLLTRPSGDDPNTKRIVDEVNDNYSVQVLTDNFRLSSVLLRLEFCKKKPYSVKYNSFIHLSGFCSSYNSNLRFILMQK